MCMVHAGSDKKRRMGRAIQWQTDKTAQRGQRLTTSQIIYLFSEHFPPVNASCLFREKSSQITHPSSSFPPSGHKSKFLHPASINSLMGLEKKLHFPTGVTANYSFLLFYYIIPSKIKDPGCFLKQKKSEKTCVWKEDAKSERKWSIAKSCGYISITRLMIFFSLALASKAKNSMNILVWEQGRNREK